MLEHAIYIKIYLNDIVIFFLFLQIVDLEQIDFWKKDELTDRAKFPPTFNLCVQRDKSCSPSEILSIHLTTITVAGDNTYSIELPLNP